MEIKNKKYKNLEVKVSNEKVDYLESISFLENRVEMIYKEKERELIWFLEHPSIYTSGRGQFIKTKHIDKVPVYNTGRGGKLTWHGPGQRIIYMAINLKKKKIDIRKFVNSLENFIISSLQEINIHSFKKPGLIGIWTKENNNLDAKIASLGLRVSKGIIYHGISINLYCDLEKFNKINPCGIINANVTSIKEVKRETICYKDFDKILENKLYLFY